MSSPTSTPNPRTGPVDIQRNHDFNRLWAGQTISMVGTQVTNLALPLTAVLMLHATALQMGILSAVGSLPWLLFSLFVGVWVDRLRRRPVMILADLGRFVLVALVPVSAVLHVLSLPLLWLSAMGVGTLSVFFDLADHAYLPTLVGREHLVAGNSRLELSQAVSLLLGPGLAGVLVQLLTAPIALLLDALSYLASVLWLLRIRAPEPVPEQRERHAFAEIREGLQMVFGHPVLRPIVGYSASINLFFGMTMAILILYLSKGLGFSAAETGLVLSLGAVGGIVGALRANALSLRLGVGRTLIGTSILYSVGLILLASASGPHLLRLVVLVLAALVTLYASATSNVMTVSIRQAITPDRLLGRITATVRFVIWGISPLSALLGGALGQWIGLRPTLLLVALISFSSLPWLYFSPIRRMRGNPPPMEDLGVPVEA